MTETNLLPCPFCGCEAETHQTIDRWIATCSSDQNELDGFTHTAQAYGTTEAEAIAAWNTSATHGTLTAEQVCDAIFNGSSYASFDGIRMQEIADRLNAELRGDA